MFCADLPPRVYESLKALCCLAKRDGPLQAHEIARSTRLPVAQTAKVLQWMTWAGFVKSRRGTKGGFWLVVAPEHIHVSDVISFFARRDRGYETKETGGVFRVLQRATARCQREFRHISVANLVKGQASKSRTARPVGAGRRS